MSELPDPTRSKRYGCGCIVAVLLIMAAMPAIFLFVWNHDHARKIDQQLAKIRQAGQPTTYADLESFYRVPEGAQDTTQYWLNGNKLLLANELSSAERTLPLVGDGKAIPPGEDWPQLAQAEALLKKHAEALEQFHTAAKLGGAARYPVQFSDGISAQLSHAQNLRAAVRMLMLEAYFRGHRGDAVGCADSIHAGFAARRSLEQEPYLVSYLVCVALHRATTQTIAELLSAVEFSEDDLKSFQEELRTFDPKRGLRRGFMGERVIGCEGYAGGSMSLDDGMQRSHATRVPFLNSDFSFYLELFDDALANTEADYPECLKAGTVFEQKIKSVIGSPVGKMGHMVTGMLMPAIGAAVHASATCTGKSAAADAAIAIEFFRRKHGRAPQSLAELVPAFLPKIPRDPFDGQPLRYIRQDDAYLIYSIGRNLKDDSGSRTDQHLDDVIYVRVPMP